MDRPKANGFRDLDVWQLGMSIVTDVYEITRKFPKEEMYGMVSQMRRAAVSIPSNVAEGFNRYHNREYRQFIHVALGSCGELETQFEVATNLGFIKQEQRESLLENIGHESRMLRNLAKKLVS